MTDVLRPDDPFDSHLEVRDLEKREIFGRIIPYGETTTVRGRPESFQRGALQDVKPDSIKLLAFHDQHRPVGRSISLEERADGAYATFKVSRTPLGDEMLELAADGVLSFSPGFLTGLQTRQGVHTRLKAMPETSLVTFSQYEGSGVLAVREKEGDMPDEKPTGTVVDPAKGVGETATKVDTPPPPATVDLTPLETRMDEFSTKIEKLESVADAPARRVPRGGPTPLQFFETLIPGRKDRVEKREKLDEAWEEFQTRAKNGELETRALEDITGAFPENEPADDLSGLVVEEYIASQLVNVLDTRRPFFRNAGSFPMPRSGFARIPVVTQHVEVSDRGAQKTEVPSRKMIVTTAPFEAGWMSGAVDIGLEIIQTAELPVLAMVWDDFLGQYAIATELDPDHGIVAKVEAGGLGFTYTGTALDTSDYASFIADLLTQADAVEDGSGAPATKLAVTRAQFRVLVGFVDANDRRLFATLGATNADARVPLNASSFELPGGITVFKAKGLTQAVLYNEQSLKVADGGPQRVEALNVAEMGRDLGLLGRTMVVPRIPAGVVVFGVDPLAS